MAAPVNKSTDKKSALRSTVKDQSGAGKVKIGDILRKEGHIISSQLEEALAIQKKSGQRLGSILVKLGHIDETTILNVLSRQHNFPPVDLVNEPPNPEVFKTIPFDVVKKYCALPLRKTGKTLQIAMAEPTDTTAVEGLQAEVKMGLSVCVATEQHIYDAYKKYYKISDEQYKELTGFEEEVEEEEEVTNIDDFGSLASEAADEMAVEEDGGEAVEFSATDAPIIKLVNGILIKAVQDGVSDIHIEPYEKSLQVRYRLDGSLFKSMNLPTNIKNALNSRIKILANLDITERRVPGWTYKNADQQNQGC